MMRARPGAAAIAVVLASTLAAAAQIGGKPATGNPTPGTAQPDPPNVADRITLAGCLKPAPPNGAAGTAPTDANTPSAARAVLTGAERVARVPPGTGGSPRAAKAAGGTYRLEGIDSLFSPFMNAKVQISGEIKPPSAAGGTREPTLLVEFIQRVGGGC